MPHLSGAQPKVSDLIPKIAIIGIGCNYPGANDLKTLWENILSKRQQFRRSLDTRLPIADYYDPDPMATDKTYGDRAAVIDGFEFDWVKRRIPKTTFESTDVVHWLALETAFKALEDVGYTRETVPTERTGFILGNTLTGEQTRSTTVRLRWPFVRRALQTTARAKGMAEPAIEELLSLMEEVYKSAFTPITEDSLAGGLSNTIAGRVCNFFNFQGGGYTVDGACSSSLIAISTAANALVSGDLDMALAGGVDVSLDTFELIGFAKVGALTAKDMTVYDRAASGFIPGEGCGCVVMKRLEDARRDGDYVYAVLNGWAVSSDGKGGITAPSKVGQSNALKWAYRRAGYSSHKLDFIEGHGTGTPVGDRTEIEGIALTLAADGELPPRQVGITSFKSLVGHTKAAAGVGGFIKTVLAVNQRVLPPTCGCKVPNPIFETAAQAVYPILQGEVRASEDVLTAGVSAMGFGGINCHVTITSGDVPKEHLKPTLPERALFVSHQETELFVFSAATISDLLTQLTDVAVDVRDISLAEMLDLSAHLADLVDPSQPIKAAVIADSPKHLLQRLSQLKDLAQDRPCLPGTVLTAQQDGLPQEVWLSHSTRRDRVAFLFPGQGSQRLNMARVLVERHPWAQALLDNADQWLKEIDCEPISPYIFRPIDRAESSAEIEDWMQSLTRADIAPAAICFSSLVWHQYLTRLGITPVAVGGHSLGELSAFYAAGAYDAKTLLQFAAIRGKATILPPEKAGTMVSLGCDRSTAETLLKRISGYAVVANINHPQQTVVSGEVNSVGQVLQVAAEESIYARQLAVSNAFHSALIEEAAVQVKKSAPIPTSLTSAKVPIISAVTGQPIEAGLKLHNYFSQQLTSQVDFISLIKTITPMCDLMVEVGTGKVLSKLAQANLEGRSNQCFSVESKVGDALSFNTFLGYFFVQGGAIKWNAVFENRMVRPYTSPSKRVFIANPCENPLHVPETQPFSAAPYLGQPSTIPNTATPNGSDGSLSSAQFSDEHLVNLLSDYFSHRGDFLAEIIQADMQFVPPSTNG
ncbi:MAG: type I polyketide synthase [Phormidesmis sp.]